MPENSPVRRRSPLLVAIASFALVLGVGLVASFVSDGDPGEQPGVTATTISTVPASPVGPVPESHLAAGLLAAGAGYDDFSFTLLFIEEDGAVAGSSSAYFPSSSAP